GWSYGVVPENVPGGGSYRRTGDLHGASFSAVPGDLFARGRGDCRDVDARQDDFGTWGAVVLHHPLDDTALITGGTFALGGRVRNLEGVISDGAIVRLGGSCRQETFNVTGHVMLVAN